MFLVPKPRCDMVLVKPALTFSASPAGARLPGVTSGALGVVVIDVIEQDEMRTSWP